MKHSLELNNNNNNKNVYTMKICQINITNVKWNAVQLIANLKMDQDIDKKSEFCTVIQRQKILYIRPIHLTHQNGQMTLNSDLIVLLCTVVQLHAQTNRNLSLFRNVAKVQEKKWNDWQNQNIQPQKLKIIIRIMTSRKQFTTAFESSFSQPHFIYYVQITNFSIFDIKQQP